MHIIDAHTHIEGLPGCSWQDPPEMILRLMDEAGIDKAVVMTYCDAPMKHPDYDPLLYVRDAVARYPDRLLGFARLDPGAENACDLLETSVRDWGFQGLKLHPLGYRLPPDGEATIKLLRKAGNLGIPALFHCGDEEYTFPLQLERAARLCPETTIIFGHMGGYYHGHDAIAVAKRCPNVYLETSATPHVFQILYALQELGAERIIYASDGPGCDPAIEVEKIHMLEMSEQDSRKVFHENLARLLPQTR